jgi:regulator of RNase E activity RraA
MKMDKRAYSGAIYDIIKFDLKYDKKFVLPNDIKCIVRPIWEPQRFIFGRAFTARGDKTSNPNHERVAEMIDNILPGDVYILQANDNSRAHFGDIMAQFIKKKGANGAVLQGWTRDRKAIEFIGFPVWAKGVQPQDSADRWGITSFLEEIVIGNIFITPYDYIFADLDGVLVIKHELLPDVITLLKHKLDHEDEIRQTIKEGETIGIGKRIYEEFGRW